MMLEKHSSHPHSTTVFAREAIISAWLHDVLQATNSTVDECPLLTPPSSPKSHKRKAESQPRSQNELKRHSVLEGNDVSMDEPQKTPRRSQRVAGKLAIDDHAASTKADVEEFAFGGSPTPRPSERAKRSRRLKGIDTQATARGETPRHPDPVPSRSLSHARPFVLSTYGAAIESHSASASSNPPSLPAQSEPSKGRSRSPVKGMGNLEFAEKPVVVVALDTPEQVPEDIRSLVQDLKRIKAGRCVVPAVMRDEANQKIERYTPFDEPELDDKNMDLTPSDREHLDLQHELFTLSWIVRDTRLATRHQRSEGHWNERVHSPILIAAVERDRQRDDREGYGVSVFNSTQAVITQACIPRHTLGVDLEAKMVDYCICVSDSDIEKASRNAVRSQKRYLEREISSTSVSSSSAKSASSFPSSPKKKRIPYPQSINHTEYDPFVVSPITVSIETKRPDGSEDAAKAQLAVWVSAQITRMHHLLGPAPLGITLPLLYAHGSTWQVLFATERPTKIVSTILGPKARMNS